MKATSAHRLLALSASIATLAPSYTVQADANSLRSSEAKSNVLHMENHAQSGQKNLSRKEMFEKRRLLREEQSDAEALHVRNMLMLMAVLRSQQSGALSVASVSN